MKRLQKAILILCSVMLFCTGCSHSDNESQGTTSSVDEFTRKYILTAFYGSDSDRDAFIREKKEEGVLHRIDYDEKSGYITVTASLTQAQYWLKEAENEIEQNAAGIRKDDHYSVSVNASDTEMTVSSSASGNLKDLRKTVNDDLMAMEIHQVFSGISSWQITVNLINTDTNQTVHSYSLPDDELKLDNSIWK